MKTYMSLFSASASVLFIVAAGWPGLAFGDLEG